MNESQMKQDIRPTSIGGQAVIEGVMMRGKHMYAMAVRKPDKDIAIVKKDLTPLTDKYKFLALPLLRGVVAFVDSMVIGMQIITQSAELAMPEEEMNNPDDKVERFLTKIFGDKLNDALLFFSVSIAIVLSIGLFILLPTFLAGFLKPIIQERTWILSIAEGLLRIGILVGYVSLIAQSKDIQRVFAYHGAEHKTINCFESGEDLTVENVQKHTRIHKRCGTSFLILVMLVSMVVFFFVRTDVVLMRFVYRIVLVPFIAGLSYELIRWAGKNDSALVSIISYPGMCLQKITTKEPDEGQIEIAIAAMHEVLVHEAQ